MRDRTFDGVKFKIQVGGRMSLFYDILKSAVGVFDYNRTVGEFVACEGDELVDSVSLREKNKLSYVIVIHGREYEITEQVRKFMMVW